MAFQITKPAEAVEGFHGALIGDSGVGKTSTLDDPNLKVLLIDFEGGSAVLSEAKNVDRIDIVKEAEEQNVTQYAVFEEVCKALHKGELTGYDMIAIDSFTQFEAALKEHIVKVIDPTAKRKLGEFGNQQLQDYGTLQTQMTRIVKWFHGLTKRGDNSIHVLWIAHAAEVRNDLDKSLEKIKIAISGSKTPDILMSIFDGFFYMYNKDLRDENGKRIGLERGILTQSAGGYTAKVRQSKQREPLPAKIVSPVWSEIFEQLGYIRK